MGPSGPPCRFGTRHFSGARPLIANTNAIGAPRWDMVPSNTIAGMNVLHDPFSAIYPGNSMGGVVLITTQMPETFTTTVKETLAEQNLRVYSATGQYGLSDTAASAGDRIGRVSWLLTANCEDSYAQPLSVVTKGVAMPQRRDKLAIPPGR